MKYFPIFLDANYINALIIGGGDVAARKIELLLKSTTNITVMAQHCNESVMRLIKDNNLTHLAHDYQQGLLEQFNLVIAATDNDQVNAAVAQEAENTNILVNIVDQPHLCRYITPAIIDRSPMLIAMSSSGSAPILLRMLREQIEKMLPAGYGKLAEFSYKFRDHVKARIKGVRNRRSFWEQILRGTIGEQVLQGDLQQAEQAMFEALKTNQKPPIGDIVFIHTMTGNPDKLTLEAHREMQFADAVFYDSDVNVEFIEYIRRDADKFPQQLSSSIMINFQHAIELAEQGQKVIYLLPGCEELPPNTALMQSKISYKSLLCAQ
ncbi:NAD(P)-dependent oxidoreductase [Thalassotalea ganghwensis]